MKGYVTKTGAKYHRDTCRFAKTATIQEVGKRGPCAICKPHIALHLLPVKSVGKENLRGCMVCKASCADPVTREEAPKLGFTITPTGSCYHTATCKLLNRVKGPKVAAVVKKAIKPIKNVKNINPVDAAVMSVLGM